MHFGYNRKILLATRMVAGICYNYVSCKYKYKYQVAYNKCAK